METNLLNLDNFSMLAIRFLFNMFATTLVVLLYARISRRKEFYFSYFAISVSVFLLVFQAVVGGVSLEQHLHP